MNQAQGVQRTNENINPEEVPQWLARTS